MTEKTAIESAFAAFTKWASTNSGLEMTGNNYGRRSDEKRGRRNSDRRERDDDRRDRRQDDRRHDDCRERDESRQRNSDDRRQRDEIDPQKAADIRDRNCFTCHKRGHRAEDCPERAGKLGSTVSGDADAAQNKKTEGDSGGAASQSFTYALYSQEVMDLDELLKIPIPKKKRASSHDESADDIIEIEESAFPAIEMTTLVTKYEPVGWTAPLIWCDSMHMGHWMMLPSFPGNPDEVIKASEVKKWGDLSLVETLGKIPDESQVVVCNHIADVNGTLYMDPKRPFGCLNLIAGYAYSRLSIVLFVLKKLDKILATQIGKLEAETQMYTGADGHR